MGNARRGSGLGAGTIGSEIEGEVVPHLVRSDGRALICERRHDVEALLVRVDIGLVGGCPVEGPRPEPVESDLIVPEFVIQLPLVKRVLPYETYLEL